MRFLANENIPLMSVHLLRKAGHDVVSITEQSPGILDQQVLSRAREEKRVLLSFDKDYGELIFGKKLLPPNGMVFLRFNLSHPEEAAEKLLELLNQKVPLESKFTVLEIDGFRQRSLP